MKRGGAEVAMARGKDSMTKTIASCVTRASLGVAWITFPSFEKVGSQRSFMFSNA